MDVREIRLDNLLVSNLNVRKTLTSDDDEPGINELANDIRTNGLINPLTVRKLGDKYEIIAGQRRFLASKLLRKESVACSIVDVDSQKAEEMSLVENVQRVQMTFADKVKTYSRLYSVYNKDITKVVNAVSVSKITIAKYLKLAELPDAIIELLDSNGEEKLTIDVAVELTKLPSSVHKMDVIRMIKSLSTTQKLATIRQILQSGVTDTSQMENIRDEMLLQTTSIHLAPAFPYVLTQDKKHVKIPEDMYQEIVERIQSKHGNLEYV